MRAATGKDVNAHLDWSGVWCMWPGMVAACCSRVGVGVMITLDTNQDTPTLLPTTHYTLQRAGLGCPLVIVVLAWVGAVEFIILH